MPGMNLSWVVSKRPEKISVAQLARYFTKIYNHAAPLSLACPPTTLKTQTETALKTTGLWFLKMATRKVQSESSKSVCNIVGRPWWTKKKWIRTAQTALWALFSHILNMRTCHNPTRTHNWMPAPVSTLALFLTSATSLESIQPMWEFVANLVQDMLRVVPSFNGTSATIDAIWTLHCFCTQLN